MEQFNPYLVGMDKEIHVIPKGINSKVNVIGVH